MQDKNILDNLPSSYLEAAGSGVREEVHKSLTKEQRELEEKSRTDSLTKLLNHAAFFEAAEKVYEEACRQKTPFSLIMLDLDFFKQYNDRNGHPAGDAALLALANILKQAVKDYRGLAGRWGGEEFILGLSTDEKTACQIA